MSERFAAAPNDETTQVPVGSRKILGPASTRVDVFARCPVKGHDVSLEQCENCPRCESIEVDTTRLAAAVTCRVPEESASERPSRTVDYMPRSADATHTIVSEIMTEHVICVEPAVKARALADHLLASNISGVPVVDAEGKPLGIVSNRDLLETLSALAASGAGAEEPTAGQIMQSPALCIPAGESVAKTAALMAFQGIHRMPVLGSRGQVVGIVTSLDMLRWLATEHGYVVAQRPSRPVRDEEGPPLKVAGNCRK